MVLWLPQQLVRKLVSYSLIGMMSKLGTVIHSSTALKQMLRTGIITIN